VVSFAVMAFVQLGTAVAAPPSVSITSPLNGSVSNNPTPSFSGIGEEASGEVTLAIYEGGIAEGTAIRRIRTAFFLAGIWFTEPLEALQDGTYTARAMQTNVFLETGESPPVTFTVDTAPPTVTLDPPESPSDNSTPSFTGTASEKALVTVQIHAGGTVSGTLVSRATASGTGDGWASGDASPALSTGEYTAVAVQESSLGNSAGRSTPVTFTVIPAPAITLPVVPAPVPPLASFKWFPSVPQTGETVSLVSSSTDAASPITALAWALTSTGPFQSGGNVMTTSFSTPGAHVVRLQATNAAGLSSTATETIDVSGHITPLMQPFPVVRIAGSYDAAGVKLRLLRVQQMPAGARVTVRCKGHGCPFRSASRLAVATKQGVAPIELRAFERSLPAGVTLEVLVSKPGEIGKYTRFKVRRAKLPERTDTCLNAAGTQPLACPAS
jgi:PKD domain